MADDQIRIRVSAEDSEVLKLTARMNELDAELRDLNESYQRGSATAKQYREESERIERALSLHNTALQRATTVVVNTNQAQKHSGDVTRLNALGFLYLSQAIEDAQYGLSSIVNNIPGVVMMMGGGAGLAGAVSIAAVGVNQLARNWDGLMAALGNPKVETAAERMERLAKATKLTAAEAKELAAHRERQAAAEAVGKIASETEREEARQVAVAIGRVGGPAFHRRLTDALIRSARIPELEAAAGGATAFSKAQRERLAAEAAVLMQRAAGQGGTLAQQQAAQDLLKELGIFDPFAGDPNIGEEARAREAAEISKKQRIAHERLVNTLNEQGEENERLTMLAREEERVRRKELSKQISREMQDRRHGLSERADAAMGELVSASGVANYMAQAANEMLMTPWGGQRGAMTRVEKRRAMLGYMRKGMSRKDALARVNEDEKAAIQTAGYEALAQVQSGVEQMARAAGMSPEDARRFASVASSQVLGATPDEATVRNTEATERLTQQLQRGIPIILQ